LATDAIFLALSAFYYAIEYFLFHFHESYLPIVNVLAYTIDIVIMALAIYRFFFQKDRTFILIAVPIMPTFWFAKFALNNNDVLRYFQPYISDQLLFFLAVVLYIFVTYHFLQTPGAYQKIIKERGKPKQLEEPGDYPMLLTKECYIPERSRYSHTQVIGTTGSGKTRFVFYPGIGRDIKRGAGVFICDIKSNMQEKIEEFVVFARRDLDYFCLSLGDKNSNTYNPLAGDNSDEIGNRIFTAFYNENEKGEQYYKDTAERFIRATIRILKKKFKTINLKDLYKATAHPKVNLQPICNEYKNDSDALELLKMIKDENYDKNVSGLLNKLSRFVNSEWADQVNAREPEIDIGKIISENKIFLFQPQAGKYDRDYRAVSIMVMMHIQSEIAKRYTAAEKKPFFMYLDEFSNIIYPGFKELINKAREAKVGLIFGHQALGDLEHYGKDIKNIILSNSNNKIILKNDDPETVDYFIKTIGTQTVETRVESFSTKSGTPTPAGFTNRREEQYVIQPSDLRSIVLGEAIVKIDTLYGRLIQKIHFKDIMPNLHRGVKLYRPKRDPSKMDATDNFEIMEKESEAAAAKIEPGGVPEGFITVKDLRKRAKKQDKEEDKDSKEIKGEIAEEGGDE